MLHEKIRICYEDYEAWMTTYFWEESKELYPGQVRPVILICPGGAYRMTSDREAEAIAIRFMSMGYHTAVLRYSGLSNSSLPACKGSKYSEKKKRGMADRPGQDTCNGIFRRRTSGGVTRNPLE